MNNKARGDDWRVALALPLFWLVDLILKTRFIARPLFDAFRTPENVRNALENLYCNPDQVDDELVESVCRPCVCQFCLRGVLSCSEVLNPSYVTGNVYRHIVT
jgi:hypothetical protein